MPGNHKPPIDGWVLDERAVCNTTRRAVYKSSDPDYDHSGYLHIHYHVASKDVYYCAGSVKHL